MPRVVITGAAGFIGSHLSEALLDRGWSVVGIDNLLTGNIDNIAHLTGRDFMFVKHDVTNYIYVDGPVDLVLHWASPASPIDYLELPIPTLKVGALGTHKALGLAKAKKARFVLASTSEVYGDPLEHPQKESYWGNVNPVGPRGVYDEAKRFAEAMTMAYHRYHGVDTKIVRIFNTYGPRMRLKDGRAVPAFMGQALRGEDVTVFGSGKQTRSFCYVTDLVDGLYRLMLSDEYAEAGGWRRRPALLAAPVLRRVRGLPTPRVRGSAGRARRRVPPARAQLPAFCALLRRAMPRGRQGDLRVLATARTLARDARRQAHLHGRARTRPSLAGGAARRGAHRRPGSGERAGWRLLRHARRPTRPIRPDAAAAMRRMPC